MSAFIEDFAHIAAELKKIEQEKAKDQPKPEAQQGDLSGWSDYGYPNNAPPDLTAVRENIWGIAF